MTTHLPRDDDGAEPTRGANREVSKQGSFPPGDAMLAGEPFLDGAPPVVNQRQTRNAALRDGDPDEPIVVIVPKSSKASSKRDSASWIGSLVLHSVLLVFCGLLLAPADLGRGGDVELYVWQSQKEQLQELSTFEVPSLEVEPADDAASESPDIDLADSFDLSAASELTGSSFFDDASFGRSESADGPKGSFFGIEAQGHEFVFIVDRSGSMDGHRFHRATAELTRSVARLHPSQKFYVLMFSDSHVQMFGGRSLRPYSVAATDENKRKLSEWLCDVKTGGNTRPRSAIKLAMKMSPSAIFMLSDGEFDDVRGINRDVSMFTGDADSISAVESMANPTKIHSIAFEDAVSCKNMKQLAELTGGNYRFASLGEGISVPELLELTGRAIQVDDLATAQILLRGVMATDDDDSESTRSAIVRLANAISDQALSAIQAGDDELALKHLGALARIDRTGKYTEQIQRGVVTKLRDATVTSRSSVDPAPILKTLARRYTGSVMSDHAARELIGDAMAEIDNGSFDDDPKQAFEKLAWIRSSYRLADVSRLCDDKAEELAKEILASEEESRESGDVGAYVRQLNLILQAVPKSETGLRARRLANQAALELLAQARDTKRRDRRRYDQVTRILSHDFADSGVLASARKEFRKGERAARSLMRSARTSKQRNQPQAAQSLYRQIISEYPYSVAAKNARRLLGEETSPNEMEKFISER